MSAPLPTDPVIDSCDCGGAGSREHEESADCWCHPTLDFVAENGTKVWVHHEPN